MTGPIRGTEGKGILSTTIELFGQNVQVEDLIVWLSIVLLVWIAADIYKRAK